MGPIMLTNPEILELLDGTGYGDLDGITGEAWFLPDDIVWLCPDPDPALGGTPDNPVIRLVVNDEERDQLCPRLTDYPNDIQARMRRAGSDE